MDGQQRNALTIMIVATVIAWIAWGFTIARIDPAAAGISGFALFYGTLFAAVAGSATIVGLYARRGAAEKHRIVRIAIRQGALTATAVVVGIAFEAGGLLSWLNLFFLVVALTLIELFWISLRRTAESTNGSESANDSV